MSAPVELRIGTDIVDIRRLETRIAKSRNDYVARFWTAKERSDSRGDPGRLAARWAAKEACMKTLRRGIGRIDPIDIETVLIDSVPFLRLHLSALEAAQEENLGGWQVSLSREREWATAVVIAQGGFNG
ncbi:holo-ACP synthase [Leifsonia sp. NPDC102414]|uniref:holo-ACP synthase n=1 Tax=Leifsonia sp. NPDC102414 TaxID=3364124 RepID=UPI00380DFBB7